MAAFLVAALGQSLPATHAGYFPDVPAGAWFSPYVELLKELGITTGYSDGTFGPDLPVSRAEMAAFLSRAFNLTAAAPGTSFGDVASNQWYAVFVEAIRVAGITSGCSTAPSLYCPLDPVKRDQMATFLARALKIGV
jgi:N-acetylmuramoyl-L-alanine amidase